MSKTTKSGEYKKNAVYVRPVYETFIEKKNGGAFSFYDFHNYETAIRYQSMAMKENSLNENEASIKIKLKYYWIHHGETACRFSSVVGAIRHFLKDRNNKGYKKDNYNFMLDASKSCKIPITRSGKPIAA